MSRMNQPTGSKPIAIVTGGVRRVGLAIAEALAGSGCDLVLTHRPGSEDADRAADQLRKAGTNVTLCEIDLGDTPMVEAEAASLARSLPRVDVLVHNAAVYERRTLAEATAEHALAMYRANALAPLLLSRALAPRLAASDLPGGGSITAMVDIHAMGMPRVGYAAYAMSKSAMVEQVRSLAVELAPRVRVNGVAPGVVAWPDNGPDADEQMQARYLARVPLGRSGTPADAAEAVRWLALDAHYTTGQIIRVDGGRALT
jgi:pteridine reductase